jgi:RNA polymerase sigma factor (TIGR02999 family)
VAQEPSTSGLATQPWLTDSYDDLRRFARWLVRRKAGDDHSIEPTGLVHEAAIKLSGGNTDRFRTDPEYALQAARMTMRRILVERARARKARKRGGDWTRVPLDDTPDPLERRGVDAEALFGALDGLAARKPRQAEAFQLRFLLGLEFDQIAERLGVSLPTIHRDLRLAREGLARRLRVAGFETSD